VQTQSPPFAKGAKSRPPEVVSAHQGCATRLRGRSLEYSVISFEFSEKRNVGEEKE